MSAKAFFMDTSELIILRSGDMAAGIAAQAGGSVAYWRQNGTDLLRPATKEALDKNQADATGMFPLVPYSNRIRGGSFIYWGVRRKVPKNHPLVDDPLHGEGWMTAWTVQAQSDDSASLCFDHNGKTGFPFAYHAQETFSLTPDSLKVVMKLTNTGGIPMPCGLGMHPYFPKTNDAVVTFKTRTVWAHEGMIASDKPIKTPADLQFSNGIRPSSVTLDACFGGCDGKVLIEYPEQKRKLTITAQSDFNHTVVWTPENADFFCVEPVTNANDAFNLASHGVTGTGIKTLEPSESLTETITFTAAAL